MRLRAADETQLRGVRPLAPAQAADADLRALSDVAGAAARQSSQRAARGRGAAVVLVQRGLAQSRGAPVHWLMIAVLIGVLWLLVGCVVAWLLGRVFRLQ